MNTITGKKCRIFPFVVCVGSFLHPPYALSGADGKNYDKEDQIALSVPEKHTHSPQALARYLKKQMSGEESRARMLYRWVTANIAYDVEDLYGGKAGDNSPEGVLKRRKAICAGFAALFSRVAREIGLEAVVVGGGAKGYGYVPGTNFGPHAWNAVKIVGEWKLLDVTWGAGPVSKGKFERNFSEHFFLTPPELMIYTHLPDETRWQLLAEPLSTEQFAAQIDLSDSFFRLGFSPEDLHHRTTRITLNSDEGLRLRAPAGVEIRAYAGSADSSNMQGVAVTESQGSFVIPVQKFNSSVTNISIFAGRPSEGNVFQGILEYQVLTGVAPQLTANDLSAPVAIADGCGAAGLQKEDLNHKNSGVAVEADFALEIADRQDMEFSSRLEHEGVAVHRGSIVLGEEGKQVVRAVFSQAGIYHLLIFGRAKGEGGPQTFCMRYKISATGNAGGKVGFPEVHGRSSRSADWQFSPQSGYLKIGEVHNFNLTIPGASEVIVHDDSERITLKNNGAGQFSGRVKISGKKVAVFAAFEPAKKNGSSSSQSYTSILSYEGY